MLGISAFSPFVDGGVLMLVFGGFILAARVIQKQKYGEGDVRKRTRNVVKRYRL